MLKNMKYLAPIVAVSLALNGCGSAAGSDQNTMKVAIFPTNSGPLAGPGQDVRAGSEMAVDAVNAEGGVDGHKVELVELSTDGSAAETHQLVRRAVEREGAHFVTGIVSSPEVTAVMPQLESLGAVLINSSSKADSIPSACNPNVITTTTTNSMSVRGVTDYLGKADVSKWAIVAVDTVSGREAVDAFTKDMASKGANLTEPVYVPAGTTDLGTVITLLKGQDADGLFSAIYGTDSGTFLKQANAFGLLDSYKVVAGQSFNTEVLWDGMGDVALGTIGNIAGIGHIADDPRVKNKTNDVFVADYEDKYGSPPSYTAADAYMGLETLFAGVEAAGSIDPTEVKSALAGLEFDSIVGPTKVRADDLLVERDEYAGEVVRNGDGYTWKLLEVSDGSDIAPPPEC